MTSRIVIGTAARNGVRVAVAVGVGVGVLVGVAVAAGVAVAVAVGVAVVVAVAVVPTGRIGAAGLSRWRPNHRKRSLTLS